MLSSPKLNLTRIFVLTAMMGLLWGTNGPLLADDAWEQVTGFVRSQLVDLDGNPNTLETAGRILEACAESLSSEFPVSLRLVSRTDLR